MEVTVTIPDEFVEQLIPAGSDASRVLIENLVDKAYGDGRISTEQKNEILDRAGLVEADGHSMEREDLQPFFERYLEGRIPDWIDDPEQVRLHAAAARFIGIANSGKSRLSESVREIVRDRLAEKYGR